MTPFQGTARSRLSPLLTKILEQAGHAALSRKASGVAELSRLFTKERDALGRDYLKDPVLAAAYVRYFLPVNLSKIQILLNELPEEWHKTPHDRRLRVLDVGSGPGTGSLAVLDWLNDFAPDSLKRLTVVAVDESSDALSQARRLWTACAHEIHIGGASLSLHEADIACNGWLNGVAQQGAYDLIILANCLNELFGRMREPTKERSALVAGLLTLLAPHGTLMIVEPALRETSRALHQVRDQLLEEKRCTVYSPCLHERHCPALINPDDWCHEERAWEAPALIREIDRDVGFIKDALKFSYLLLRTDGRTIVERGLNTYRMVSELRKLKGDTRAWLCNERGRCEVGRLDRAGSAANAAWDQCQRGTIVRIEGITRKEGATLSRIPAEAMVEIVRSS